ncbi:diguanylate cyclase [uncultured Ferrimonas sp.]|uniref:diguanylate cyclase n=1 Tax=uncultured Ferrimonas sp. TaxID=432640 RepID=UPI002622D0F2|nr:diguanylate cyclase [uncultured Ferrimonas sp.]
MQKRVLIIEDSRTVSKVMQHLVKNEPEIDAIFCTTLAEAEAVLDKVGPHLFAAIVDLNLPDAPNGEAVELTLARQLPTIVLTGSFDNERRERLQAQGIVDYITKEGRHSYQLALKLILRLDKNTQQTVLVVDDSATVRSMITTLLQRHLFHVVEAANGRQALQCLTEHPHIRLVLTDYQMPELDGFALIQHLRRQHDYDDLCIIGLSSANETSLSAKFIKFGANDFLHKPFCHEEFYCRVNSNMESIERIQLMRDNANQDALTGLYNRRYFFETGPKLMQQSREQKLPLSVAVIDIDHFKLINDTHGHQTGDMVLKGLARTLKQGMSRFLIARAGGEEFFVVMPGIDSERAHLLLDTLRQVLADKPIKTPAGPIVVKFSAGVTDEWEFSLDQQLQRADEFLYQAKSSGRDQVISDRSGHTS